MKKTNMPLIATAVILIGLFLLPMAPYVLHAGQNETSVLTSNILLNEMEGWFARVFDPNYHKRSKLPPNLQASTQNPTLGPRQRQWQTFQSSVDQSRAPGIDYYTAGAPVRAVAAGIVLFVGETKAYPGHPNGSYVRVVHDLYDNLQQSAYPRKPLYRNQVYRSSYYHLSKVAVAQWQAVNRGDVIGYGMVYGTDDQEKVKLVLEERGNWVNPDHYGPGHSFMVASDQAAGREIRLDEMNQRLDRQLAIVQKLNGYYSAKQTDDIFKKAHGQVDTEKYANYPVRWSTVDRFHYLAHLYQSNKSLFPDLDEKNFNDMREGFYANQAIYLTLPF